MKRMFLVFIFVPLFLSAHIQDEDLFKTSRVPAAALLLLDRSGSMYNETETFDVDVGLLNRSFSSSVPNIENFSAWFDSTQYPYNYPLNDMGSFVGDPAGGDWVLNVIWEEPGSRPRTCDLDLSWTLRILDGSGWHEYPGGTHSWHRLSDYQERNITIPVPGLGNVEDVECYVEFTTDDGLKIAHVGVHLKHTPGVGITSNRMKDALLVIHSLLDVNADGIVDSTDEFPIKLGQGFFDDSKVFVGENREFAYNANNHLIRADVAGTYNNPIRWDQVSKTWVDDLTGWDTLYTDTMGASVATIWEHINTTEMNGSTPNGMLVDSAVQYIAEYRNAHPELWCMKFSVVLVTDGTPNVPRTNCYPSTAIDPGGPPDRIDYTDDQRRGAVDLVRSAYLAFHGDRDTISGPDSIRVYTVGYGTGIDANCANVLNWTARWGGTWVDSALMSGNDTAIDPSSGCSGDNHKYYTVPASINPQEQPLTGYAYIAEDASDLANALRSIFMGIESQQARSFSSAQVTSIEEEFLATGYEARMYLGSFYPDSTPFWEGHLRSVKLVTGGLSFDDIPDELVYWNAGDLLRGRDPATRNIYGIKGGSLQEFNSSNFDSVDLDVASSGDANEVINLVRSGNIVTQDTAYLGDIFHSSPLRVGSPNAYYLDDDFGEYRDSMIARTAVIYAGSNTGLLHAFADSSGEELFAVVPRNFIPEVKALRDSHRFFVDADPMAADIWFPTSTNPDYKDWNEWKTVLMVAQGEGGRGITALDVTNPSSPSHLFSFEHDTMGLTTSVPIMYKVGRNIGTDTVDRFFAFFGGGECPDSLWDRYNPATASDSLKGNVIVAIDIYKAYTDGLSEDSTFWFIPPASGDADRMVYPFASAGSMVNLNSRYDNRYDLLYIPDLAGQMWKVDVSDPDISTWEARCIFQPPIPDSAAEDSIAQPAFYAPLIEREPALGCYWVFYGTGDRAHIFKENTNNRFYAILDTVTFESGSYPLTENDDLKNAWTEGPFNLSIDFPDNNGWFISYSDSSTHVDEKTVSQAVMLKDTLIFSTFKPTEFAGDCNMGVGGAREYYCKYKTGGGRIRNLGGGIPQAPRYSFSMEGGVLVVHQTSDSILVETGTGYGTLKRILKWKER